MENMQIASVAKVQLIEAGLTSEVEFAEFVAGFKPAPARSDGQLQLKVWKELEPGKTVFVILDQGQPTKVVATVFGKKTNHCFQWNSNSKAWSIVWEIQNL